MLLIGRRRSGCFPWRCWHGRRSAGQTTSRIRKRRSKQQRETREGQTRRDGQRTDDPTLIVDGMKMEWRAHTDTWAMHCDMHEMNCANCTRKMTCEVYLSTHPVGYSGSLSTVHETNCSKKVTKKSYELTSNSIQTCPTTMCLKKNAISCIVLEKWVLQLVRLARGGDDFW